MVKNLPANAPDLGDAGVTLGLGRAPGGGNANPLQSCCLENPMDRGVWQGTVHRVTKNQTQLKQLSIASSIEFFIKKVFDLGQDNFIFCASIFLSVR